MYIEDIETKIEFLRKSLKEAETEMEKLRMKVPENARLRAIKHGNGYQYYVRKEGASLNGEYLKKEDIKMAAILAQIEFDEKLALALRDSLMALNKFRASYKGDPFKIALDKMAPGKKELVRTAYVSDEEYVADWLKQEYEGLPFKEDTPEFFTRKGLRVRSKSEVIIADMLDEASIPFLYEKPLKLQSGDVHPDFTLLDLVTRSEKYWEHFGLMDDMDYRNNAFSKIRNYEASGYYQHDSLIWTFETGKYPLNTRVIRKMIYDLKKSLGYGS